MIECFNLQIQRKAKGSDLTAPKKFEFPKHTIHICTGVIHSHIQAIANKITFMQ